MCEAACAELPPFSPHSTFTFALSCHRCARSLPVLPFSHPFFHTILFSSCPSPSVCPPSFHQSLPPFRFPSISCRSHWSFIFRSCQELACAPFMLYPLLHPKSKCPRNTMAMRCSCMLYSACVRNQATVGVYIRGGEHGVLGSIYKEEEEER